MRIQVWITCASLPKWEARLYWSFCSSQVLPSRTSCCSARVLTPVWFCSVSPSVDCVPLFSDFIPPTEFKFAVRLESLAGNEWKASALHGADRPHAKSSEWKACSAPWVDDSNTHNHRGWWAFFHYHTENITNAIYRLHNLRIEILLMLCTVQRSVQVTSELRVQFFFRLCHSQYRLS